MPSRTTQPGPEDVIRVMRVLADMRDLRGDVAAQRKRLADGATQLFGAMYAFTVVFDRLTPTQPVEVRDLILGGTPPAELGPVYECGWAQSPELGYRSDPLIAHAADSPEDQASGSVESLIGRTAWERSPIYPTIAEPLKLGDVAVTYRRSGARAMGLSVIRGAEDRPYSPREVALLGLLAREWLRDHDEQGYDWLGTQPVDLTDRQRDVLRLMLRGLGAKQIAQELGLQAETVYAYSKAMYARYRVSDRQELTSRFLPDSLKLGAPSVIRPARPA